MEDYLWKPSTFESKSCVLNMAIDFVKWQHEAKMIDNSNQSSKNYPIVPTIEDVVKVANSIEAFIDVESK